MGEPLSPWPRSPKSNGNGHPKPLLEREEVKTASRGRSGGSHQVAGCADDTLLRGFQGRRDQASKAQIRVWRLPPGRRSRPGPRAPLATPLPQGRHAPPAAPIPGAACPPAPSASSTPHVRLGAPGGATHQEARGAVQQAAHAAHEAARQEGREVRLLRPEQPPQHRVLCAGTGAGVRGGGEGAGVGGGGERPRDRKHRLTAPRCAHALPPARAHTHAHTHTPAHLAVCARTHPASHSQLTLHTHSLPPTPTPWLTHLATHTLTHTPARHASPHAHPVHTNAHLYPHRPTPHPRASTHRCTGAPLSTTGIPLSPHPRPHRHSHSDRAGLPCPLSLETSLQYDCRGDWGSAVVGQLSCVLSFIK